MMGVNILEECRTISLMAWDKNIWSVVNIIKGNIVLEWRRVWVSIASLILRNMRDSFDKIWCGVRESIRSPMEIAMLVNSKGTRDREEESIFWEGPPLMVWNSSRDNMQVTWRRETVSWSTVMTISRVSGRKAYSNMFFRLIFSDDNFYTFFTFFNQIDAYYSQILTIQPIVL